MERKDIKLNTWYKRTDIDYNKKDKFKSYTTHFHVVDFNASSGPYVRLDHTINACNSNTLLSNQVSATFSGDYFVECSQEEIDLLLNQQYNYEVY